MFGSNDNQQTSNPSGGAPAMPTNQYADALATATQGSPPPPPAKADAGFTMSDTPVDANQPAGPPTAITESGGPALDDNALLELKKQALHSLQPLVGHLDQTPEEKFKTTMMLIQATDNPSLVQEAYSAANQITDEKIRAQALLDVVNEINYFTHKDEAQS
ncbi:MAG TPA: hypothetical protein VFW90_03335 [Candidatus Saccharimonadales bacterium]|nr:hypothetical protein [Candidatus Saccharimonadales bacterium]